MHINMDQPVFCVGCVNAPSGWAATRQQAEDYAAVVQATSPHATVKIVERSLRDITAGETMIGSTGLDGFPAHGIPGLHHADVVRPGRVVEIYENSMYNAVLIRVVKGEAGEFLIARPLDGRSSHVGINCTKTKVMLTVRSIDPRCMIGDREIDHICESHLRAQGV